MQELLGAGVYPDAVVGVSAGAMNAVYVASTELDQAGVGLVNVWHDVAMKGIYDGGASQRLWALARHKSSIDPGSHLEDIIVRHCPVHDPSECRLPVRIGAMHLSSGEPVWFD
jgi:predicted acylesterase/phospholipase RssA